MTARARTAVWAGAVGGPVLLAPLLLRPLAAFALVVALAAGILAAKSVAWPLGLAAVPSVVVGLTGSNPFPKGALTLLLFLWTLAAVAVAVSRSEPSLATFVRSPAVVLTVALVLWVLVRSTSTQYGTQKLQLFVLVNVAALLGGLAVASAARHFALWTTVLLATTTATAVLLANKLAGGGAAMVTANRYVLAESFDPIAFGRSMGLGILLAVFLLLSGVRARTRTLAIAAIPLLGVAFIAAGSRGPFVGLSVGLVALALLSSTSRLARRRLLLLAPLTVVAVFLIGRLVPGQTVSRVFSFLTGSGPDTRGENRLELWSTAWNAFANHPFGGIGSGGFASFGLGELYPHNIFLEVASELGLPGVLLLVGLIGAGVAAGRRAWRGELRTEASFALALLAFAVANALFSADLSGNAHVWLAIGLASGLDRRRRRFDLGRLRPERRPAPEPAPEPPAIDAGAVVQPPDGAAVAGMVRLVATAARTGWGVGAVRFQYRRGDEEWRDVLVEDEAYDVVARSEGGTTHMAVVRSRRLAGAVVGALRQAGFVTVDVRPARARPWEHALRTEAVWNTREHPDGRYALRAQTRDMTGALIASEPIELVVDNTPPQLSAEERPDVLRVETADGVSGIASVRFESLRDGSWHEEAVLTEPPFELPYPDAPVRAVARDRAGNEAAWPPLELADPVGQAPPVDAEASWRVAEEAARLEGLRDELELLRSELDERRAAVAQLEPRAQQLAEDEDELARRVAEVERREQAANGRELQLAERTQRLEAELAAREQAALARELRLTAEERVQEALAVSTAEREQRLDEERERVEAERQAIEAREAELTAREQRIGAVEQATASADSEARARLASAVERERLLAEAEEELAARLQRFESEREAVAAARAKAESGTDRLAERAAALDERERALAERERVLAEASDRLAAQESALQKISAAAAERERRLAEVERVAAVPPPEPVAAPEPVRVPEPVPVPPSAPVPVAAPEPARAAASGEPLIWELERLVSERPSDDPYVQDEREATLFQLRQFADVDGTIPARFRSIVDDVFGPLLWG